MLEKRPGEKDSVQGGVTLTVPNKVVIGRMGKRQLLEIIGIAEVIQKIRSSQVGVADIEVASEVDGSTRVGITEFIKSD